MIAINLMNRFRQCCASDGQVVGQAVHTVFFIEAFDDYVKVHTKEGFYLKKKTMAHYETVLDPSMFVRVHRSFLLNLQELTRIEPLTKDSHVALLKSGARVPLSEAGFARLREVLGI